MNYAGGCAGVSLFMWHLLTQSMKEFPGYSLSVWVGGGMAGGGVGQPVTYSEERKGECMLGSIPGEKKKKKVEKRKTRIPSAGRAVLRDWCFINTRACTHTHTHARTKHRHRPAMNAAPMCFLSLVTLVWMI